MGEVRGFIIRKQLIARMNSLRREGLRTVRRKLSSP